MNRYEIIRYHLDHAFISFGNVKSGEQNSRYKSWEYCHNAFLELHKKPYQSLNNEDYDYLALHLAFYLASFGMYRGSSYILSRDYCFHIRAVRIIMEPQYNKLWDFDPSETDIKFAANLLFRKKINTKELDDIQIGLYYRLYNIYSVEKDDDSKSKRYPSETLVTKVLLGTIACIPAFDNYFNYGHKCIFKKGTMLLRKGFEIFLELGEFVKTYRDILIFNSGYIYYPSMRCLDIFVWRFGAGIKALEEMKKGKNFKKNLNLFAVSNYFDQKIVFNTSNIQVIIKQYFVF